MIQAVQGVVHCRREPCDVYIGRPGDWGNPFRIGPDGTRAEVIAKFEQYLRSSPVLLSRLPELRGKVLGCHCAPGPCHGDVLAKYAGMARLLVTGSRGWAHPRLIQLVLQKTERIYANPDGFLLIDGQCDPRDPVTHEPVRWETALQYSTPRQRELHGADWLAARIAEYRSWAVEYHPADWDSGRGTGFARNSEMAAAGPDFCAAFLAPCVLRSCAARPEHPSHGGRHCALEAMKRSIPVRCWKPDGSFWDEQSLTR